MNIFFNRIKNHLYFRKTGLDNTVKKSGIVFFGDHSFSVATLRGLRYFKITPHLIVTTKTEATTPIKTWATLHGIPLKVIEKKDLTSQDTKDFFTQKRWGLFLVSSFPIIPEGIFNIPRHGTLNVHPSLLPKFRGPASVAHIILNGPENTGVSIIQIDIGIDHGPIIAQRKIPPPEWPPSSQYLSDTLGYEGGILLGEILDAWINGRIAKYAQDEEKASYAHTPRENDGELNLADPPELNLRKVKAYSRWPIAFFYSKTLHKKIYVFDAKIKDGVFLITHLSNDKDNILNYETYCRDFGSPI